MLSPIHDKGKSDKRKLEKYYAGTVIELGNKLIILCLLHAIS
jgi:hypothetical protein